MLSSRETSPVLRRTIAASVGAATVVGLGFAVATTPAQAAPFTYTINATYGAGGTLTGTITFDAAACAASASAPDCPEAYTDWNLTSSASGVYGQTTYTPTTSEVLPTSSASALAIASPAALVVDNIVLNLAFNPSLAVAGSHSLAPFTLDDTDYISLELHTQYLSDVPPDAAYRLISGGTAAAATTASMSVKARSANKSISNSRRTTVVKSAKVRPATAGKLKSIKVSCSKNRSMRGDVSYCSYTKNLKTGKVTVTPYAGKGTKVKVTIKTKAKSGSSYTPQTWKRTWSVK
ncbi:MAG: hypothetical protein V9E85_08380 [Candidatus Nanopelagicales bacterium]